MDENVLRRIANNHQVSFKIEAMSWDDIGGVRVTAIKDEEDGSKSRMDYALTRYNIEAIKDPNMLLATTLEYLLNHMEEE